jgi:hypothetical protein
MEELKQFEDLINNYEIKEVNMNSILGMKKLADSINNFEKKILWKDFENKFNSIIQKFIELDIIIDPSLKDIKEYPKNIIIIMKDTIFNYIKKDLYKNKLEELNKIHTDLIKEYIEQEDKQEEIEASTNYLYDLIDEKFDWLDDNEEFNNISELLEKISKEICEGILKYIDRKKQFCSEYYKEYDELYVKNFIKSYILHNFNDIFNQACLDVLDQNNIKDEDQMKLIISLYYDYTKSTTKMMLTLDDYNFRMNKFI